MNVNFTIIMQMVHFGIAYIIIDRLVLRPTVNLIFATTAEQERIDAVITQSYERVDELKRVKAARWQSYRDVFKYYSPKVIPGFTRSVLMYERIEPVAVSEELKRQTIENVETALLSKVDHV